MIIRLTPQQAIADGGTVPRARDNRDAALLAASIGFPAVPVCDRYRSAEVVTFPLGIEKYVVHDPGELDEE